MSYILCYCMQNSAVGNVSIEPEYSICEVAIYKEMKRFKRRFKALHSHTFQTTVTLVGGNAITLKQVLTRRCG